MILVVDDDKGMLRLLQKALEREGFEAVCASSAGEAVEWLAANRAELLLLDLQLQDRTGQEVIEQLTATERCPPFLIMTGQGDERVAVEMMKRGALDYLVKDADFLQFLPQVIHRAFEQLEKERRLAAAEEQVRLIRSVVEQGFSGVLITSADMPDPTVAYINPAFARATGCRAEEVVGQPLSSLVSLGPLRQHLREGMPKRERFLEEVAAYQTTEGERWGEWRVGPVKDSKGSISHWLIIFRDITERMRLEKEILEISDRERQRIGGDLHDGLCQQLTGIELMSQLLAQKLAARSRRAAEQADEIARHVREAISQTRLLARGLSPVPLESEGLMSALGELAGRTEKMFRVQCRFICSERVVVRDQAAATHLFRIAQEAVSNGIKHGSAKNLAIELHSFSNHITLAVADDGTGFPPVPGTSGMGLRIMRYRAGVIGGTLSIQPNSPRGTIVSCSVPLLSTRT